MQSIRVPQQAFGMGITGPIRDVVSMRVLVAVDGQLGTAPPSYERFEESILTAAREIAGTKGKIATGKLEDALDRQAEVLGRGTPSTSGVSQVH